MQNGTSKIITCATNFRPYSGQQSCSACASLQSRLASFKESTIATPPVNLAAAKTNIFAALTYLIDGVSSQIAPTVLPEVIETIDYLTISYNCAPAAGVIKNLITIMYAPVALSGPKVVFMQSGLDAYTQRMLIVFRTRLTVDGTFA